MARYKVILYRDDEEVEAWYETDNRRVAARVQILSTGYLDRDKRYHLSVFPVNG